jgi:hypothetical protein
MPISKPCGYLWIVLDGLLRDLNTLITTNLWVQWPHMQQKCTLDLGKSTRTGKALPKSNSSPQKCQRRSNVKQYKPPGVHQYRKQKKTTTVKVTTVSLVSSNVSNGVWEIKQPNGRFMKWLPTLRHWPFFSDHWHIPKALPETPSQK